MSRSQYLKRLAVTAAAIALAGCATGAITSLKINQAQTADSGLIYALPMGRLKVQVTAGYYYYPAIANKDPKKSKPAELELALLAPAIVGVETGPDADARYVLKLAPSAMSDDHFCIGLTATGLLQTVGIVTSDRSADVIKNLAGTVAVIAGGAPGGAGLKFETAAISGSDRKDGQLVFDKAPFVEVLLDPDSTTEIAGAQATIRAALWSRQMQVERNPAAALKESDKALDVKDVKFQGIVGELATQMSGEGALLALDGGAATDPVAAPGPTDGVYYRAPVQKPFTVSPANKIGGKSQTALATLPDRRLTASIGVTRGPFIRKQSNLVLTDGMLTSVDINKPSEALAVAGLPLDVAGAVIETPARFFTAIASATKSETALLKAKADLLQAEAEILKVKQGQDGNLPDGAAFSTSTTIGSAPNAPSAFTTELSCSAK